ncbi:MAG: hypothetical protein ACHQIO_04620, partial [Nevskiales bacterium]
VAPALWAVGWVPPPQPDPLTILRQAQADAAAKHYADALAKHIWFHEHALDYAQGLYGVRLSYALNAWTSLGRAYPPALEKLRAERDAAADHVRQGDGARGYFNEVVAIDRALKDDAATRELFVWLDANRNEVASQVYDLAQSSLVRAKDYALCGKYLQPQKALQAMLDQYHTVTQLAATAEHPDEMKAFAQKTLANKTGLLVALLVQNHRKDEANAIAAQAVKEWDDGGYRQQLIEALSGEVPQPWPL